MRTSTCYKSWHEGCRFRAVELVKLGWTQATIAIALGLSQSSVSKILKKAREQGIDSLFTQPIPGRPPHLTPTQMEELRALLTQGATAHGFVGNVWTSPRVATLLQRHFGIYLSDRQVLRILHQMHWTLQKPVCRAVQRDEAAITQWLKKRWPYLKRIAHRSHRLILFIDETGVYLVPSRVQTWAPRGETPFLQEMFTHEHLSVITAVSRHGDIYYFQQPVTFDSAMVVAFLEAIHRRLPDQKLLVIWDGAPIHRSKLIQQYLDDGAAAWLRLERLPGYAPELNPVEGIWQYLKQVELRNVAAMTMATLATAIQLAMMHIVAHTNLVLAFFRHAGVT